EFDGPGNCWSPETFLVGAVGDCFILNFARSLARRGSPGRPFDATGTLDRIDHVTQFTKFEIKSHLEVPADTAPKQAQRAREKAEHTCLLSNSLKGLIRLQTGVDVAAEPVAGLVTA